MTEPAPWVFAGSFVAALLLTWACMPLALKLAARYGIVDRPGGYKVQDGPVPYLGGVVIVAGFSAAVLAAAAFAPEGVPLDQLAILIATGVGLSFVGLADDLRGLNPYVRLLIEIVAGAVVVVSGAGVSLFPGAEAVNAAITVLWVVGVTNAFNLLDNMDGLSGGVAAVAALAYFAIAILHDQFLVAALAAALAGCALGFLRHNFHPARIYMGDAGSLFLGFLLAVIGLKLRFEGPASSTFFVPILVLGVALFDTTLVVLTRLAHRQSPFVGGRDHVSHRLVLLGLPVPAAVSLIYGGAIALAWLALLMAMLQGSAAIVLMSFVLAVALFFGVLLGRVPVYENSKRKRIMLQEVAPYDIGPSR